MKKTIIPLIILGIIIVGCNKTNDKCEGEGCPCEQTDCTNDEYAPDNTDFSWDEYNDVATFMEYFMCHNGTVKEQVEKQDTFKVMGWVYFGVFADDYLPKDSQGWHPQALLDGSSNVFFLTGDSSQRVPGKYPPVHLPQTILDSFRLHFDEYSSKQLYISGTMMSEEVGCSCCNWPPVINATSLDTLPQY